jgi:hypothetical protein
VVAIRYEDLLADPRASFERILRTLGLPLHIEKLTKATDFSSFDALKQQEISTGFKERPYRADTPFFRQGRSGSWREALPRHLADKIISAHSNVMQRFGYLNEFGNPVY